MSRITNGARAGAAGTAVLNAVTYLDVAVRGRPPSSIPEQDVQQLAERAGASLSDDDTAQARRSGLGALLGYVSEFVRASGPIACSVIQRERSPPEKPSSEFRNGTLAFRFSMPYAPGQ